MAISPIAQQVLGTLPPHIQRDIKSFLEDNPWVDISSRRDLVTAWLTWNGIIGYEDQIIDLVLGCARTTIET